MGRLTHHVFVCEAVRPPGHPKGCCTARGSDQIRDAFKMALMERGLVDTVRANAAGCLDVCEFGPTVVVYPDAVWYGRVTLEDVDEIVDSHIVGGQPVERLRIDTAAG